MKFLVLLLLVSSAHATTFTGKGPLIGEVLSGQIYVDGTGGDFNTSLTGTFQTTGSHTIRVGGFVNPFCHHPCDLEELRSSPVILLSEGSGLLIDNSKIYGSLDSAAGGFLFRQVSFFDVISGDFLTVTGQAVGVNNALFADLDLNGPVPVFLRGDDEVVFYMSNTQRWRYTAHYRFDPNYLEAGVKTYIIQDMSLTTVPELGSLALTLTGMLGLGFFRKTISRLRRAR